MKITHCASWPPLRLWSLYTPEPPDSGSTAGILELRRQVQMVRADKWKKAVEVLSRLNEFGVEYKVIGAMGLNVQGLIRATEDLDFFVNPTRENVERLKKALRAVWDDPCIEEINYEDLACDYPAVAYGRLAADGHPGSTR